MFNLLKSRAFLNRFIQIFVPLLILVITFAGITSGAVFEAFQRGPQSARAEGDFSVVGTYSLDSTQPDNVDPSFRVVGTYTLPTNPTQPAPATENPAPATTNTVPAITPIVTYEGEACIGDSLVQVRDWSNGHRDILINYGEINGKCGFINHPPVVNTGTPAVVTAQQPVQQPVIQAPELIKTRDYQQCGGTVGVEGYPNTDTITIRELTYSDGGVKYQILRDEGNLNQCARPAVVAPAPAPQPQVIYQQPQQVVYQQPPAQVIIQQPAPITIQQTPIVNPTILFQGEACLGERTVYVRDWSTGRRDIIQDYGEIDGKCGFINRPSIIQQAAAAPATVYQPAPVVSTIIPAPAPTSMPAPTVIYQAQPVQPTAQVITAQTGPVAPTVLYEGEACIAEQSTYVRDWSNGKREILRNYGEIDGKCGFINHTGTGQVLSAVTSNTYSPLPSANSSTTTINYTQSPQPAGSSLKVAYTNPTYDVKELPKTGLPLFGWALGGLIPVGLKLKKLTQNTQSQLTANSIWEDRLVSKA